MDDEKENYIRKRLILAIDGDEDLDMIIYWIEQIESQFLVDIFKLAVIKGRKDIIQIILQYNDLYYYMIINNDIEAIRYLIEELNYREIIDDMLKMAYEQAYPNSKEIIYYLVEQGANPDMLLLEAVKSDPGDWDDEELIIFALDHGADINARDDKGRTAMDKAIERCKSYKTIQMVQNYIIDYEISKKKVFELLNKLPNYEPSINNEIKKYFY